METDLSFSGARNEVLHESKRSVSNTTYKHDKLDAWKEFTRSSWSWSVFHDGNTWHEHGIPQSEITMDY